MKEGMLVKISPDTSYLELGMEKRVHVGLVISKQTWIMDSETGRSAEMWRVLVDGRIQILNEFSIEEYK